MPRKIATADRVDRDELLDFVRPRHRVTLVTLRQDGRPQLSPVTAGVDQEGRVVISTYPRRAKVANLRRDPRAAALIEDGERYAELRGVQLTGEVRVVDDDPEMVVDIWTGLMVKYEAFDAEQAEAFRRVAAAKAPTQVALILEPTQVVSWDHRKLG